MYTTRLPYSHYNRMRGTSRTIYHSNGTKTHIDLMAKPLSGVLPNPSFLKEAIENLDKSRNRLDFVINNNKHRDKL